MKLIRKLIKVSRHFLFILTNINWLGFFRYHKKGSENVVISNFLSSGRFSTEGICWEFGYINFLIKNKLNFEYTSLKKMHFNKNIFWSPEITTTSINIRNYTSLFAHIASELENQGCNVFPNSYEINYLENKVFMYEQFKLRNIPHPKTNILSSINPNIDKSFNPNDEDNELEFPLIWKGEHSAGSKDIKLLRNLEDFKQVIEKKDFKVKNSNIILQEFCDIRRDLRVNVIGNDVVLSFWRINSGNDWKPTASEFGATIQHFDLPENLKNEFIKVAKDLDMKICGFDIIFEDDDIKKPFKVLEVSPRYSPNPYFDVTDKSYSYSDFKSKIFTMRSWAFLQSEEIFKHATMYLDNIFQGIKEN